MKKMVIILILMFSCFSFAQQGLKNVSEGREFWFAIPHKINNEPEAIRGASPLAFWISSRIDTRVSIRDMVSGFSKIYNVSANHVTQIPYGDELMMRVNEEVKNYGINIRADDPVSVSVFISYRTSGEAFHLIPQEFLGQKYFTLSLYQDKTDIYLPGQILIVATKDSTIVKYTPNANTAKVNKGKTGQITLNKGQCYLIESKILTSYTHMDTTDLTGTYIESSKPIAVISGHTKGTFPKLQASFLGNPGNFMRNTMIEMIPPIEELGTEYISCPLKYGNRPRGVVQNDRGDLIRFVATEDNTVIYEMRQNDTAFAQISEYLKKGQWHDIVNQENPSYYKSNNKVLVGQYGKAWLDRVYEGLTEKGPDFSQNPALNGQGMLMVLTPNDHWTSYACWKSPENIDNYIYIVFKSNQLEKLKFDSIPFKTKFSQDIKQISGTDYSWLASSIISGDHLITGDTLLDDSSKVIEATFSAYAYGNWDRTKDGFAYGYPVSYKFNKTPNIDTSEIDTTKIGPKLVAVSPTEYKFKDSKFKNLQYVSIYIVNKSYYPDFKLSRINLRYRNRGYSLRNIYDKPISIKWKDSLRVIIDFTPDNNDSSYDELGIGDSTWFQYLCKLTSDALNPVIMASDLNFGTHISNFTKDSAVRIDNNGNGILIIDSVLLEDNSFFTFNFGNPIVKDSILPQKYRFYPISVKLGNKDTLIKSRLLYRSNSKTGDSVAVLTIQSKIIIAISVSDAKFTSVTPGQAETKTATIENVSGTGFSVFSFSQPKNSFLKINFPYPISRQNPLQLMPGEKVDFTIDFTAPNEYAKNYKDSIIFSSDANYGDSVAVITASTLNSVEYKQNSIFSISPNPATDFIEISLGTQKAMPLQIRIYDVFGQEVNNPLTPFDKGELGSSSSQLSIQNSQLRVDVSTLVPGLYFVRVGDNVGKFLKI